MVELSIAHSRLVTSCGVFAVRLAIGISRTEADYDLIM
jgi:hypothetical protein